MLLRRKYGLTVMSAVVAGLISLPAPAKDCSRTSTGMIPVNDLGSGLYLGRFMGGLYPAGANVVPAMHRQAGLARAAAVEPLDRAGRPDPNGKYVLISIGMSNTTQEFCGGGGGDRCAPGSFMDQALQNPNVDDTHLVILDGAKGGQAADAWDSPDERNYDRIRDDVLAPRGLTEAQVQSVWVKVANRTPQRSLPDSNADAYVLLEQMGNIARALQVRYPNVKVVVFSSRIYAGYADTALNPEPYAYESAFAVKWLIEAQIRQMGGGGVDPIAGDLDYQDGTAPWVAWAAYLWADGLTGRSDGLIWECDDFRDDGTHPSGSGVTKVGTLLLDYFLNSPFTVPWFTKDGGGGIPCSDVKKMKARCRNRKLKVKVVMTDESHDGEIVTIDVNGHRVDLPIDGNKAKFKRTGQSGPQRVELVDPPRCVPPRQVDCG